MFREAALLKTLENILDNFSEIIMLWYNIPEYFHHVYFSLQLTPNSPLVLSSYFSFHITVITNGMDIAIQMFSKIGSSDFITCKTCNKAYFLAYSLTHGP